ncbi:MAG: hypothetical protein OHK0013_41720 [Sandaracinaceae bacterium]
MDAAAEGDDCDDSSDTVRPGAPETCDGVDEDCDGRFDEGAGVLSDFFPDTDGDGHGAVGSSPIAACMRPEGYAAVADDCNDGDATVAPGASERCNGADEDCDGSSDEGLQRLIGTPREVAPIGEATENLSVVLALPDGYLVAWTAPSGAVLQRVPSTGPVSGAPVTLSAEPSPFLSLVRIADTRAIALFIREVAAGTRALFGVTVDATSWPPTLGAPVEIARGTSFFDRTSALPVRDRLVVLYSPSSSRVEARSFDLALDAPSAAATLLTFPTDALGLHRSGEDGVLLVSYSGTRPGASFDDVYLDRLTVATLTLEARAFRISDGSGEADTLVATRDDGRGVALVSYEGLRFEVVRFDSGRFGADPEVTSRTPMEIGDMLAFAYPTAAPSAAGIDLGLSVSPGSPPAAVQWRSVSWGAEASSPVRFGGAQYIASVASSRRSSQRGALVWTATATGDTRQQVLLQEIGCE